MWQLVGGRAALTDKAENSVAAARANVFQTMVITI